MRVVLEDRVAFAFVGEKLVVRDSESAVQNTELILPDSLQDIVWVREGRAKGSFGLGSLLPSATRAGSVRQGIQTVWPFALSLSRRIFTLHCHTPYSSRRRRTSMGTRVHVPVARGSLTCSRQPKQMAVLTANVPKIELRSGMTFRLTGCQQQRWSADWRQHWASRSRWSQVNSLDVDSYSGGAKRIGHLHQLLAPVGIPGAGNVLVRDRIAVWLHCGLGHRSMGQRTVGAHVRMKAVVKEGAEACMHSTITMSGPCPGYRASRRGRRTRVA